MTKIDWNYLAARKSVVLKLAYDAIFSAFALALAFVSRLFIVFAYSNPEDIRPDISSLYLRFYGVYLFPFVLITVGTLWALGFYKLYPKSAWWKPLKIVSALSLAALIWSQLLYFTTSSISPSFPRGVSLLAWGFLILLIGLPRIVKYYLLNKVVLNIDHHRKDKVQNVLVIGGAGYIGSQLCRDLLAKGYRVRVLDTLMFGNDSLKEIEANKNLDIVHGDFRNIESVVRALRGMDAVVHLGGIVGDPACALDDDFTIEVNLSATILLAEMCKVFKIERFVFASSCSVYGAGTEDFLTETSELNPVSLYARTKIASEEVLVNAVNESFAPTILRFATLFGLSPRPRFDLFINLVTAKAAKEGKFTVFGGDQWRPFVHVRDICKTIITVLNSPIEKVKGEIINVGSDENCCTIADGGRLVASLIPGTAVEFRNEVDDARDYRVSFAKLRQLLGISLDVSLEAGIVEIRDAFKNGSINDFSDTVFSNLKGTEKVLSLFNQGELSGLQETEPLRPTVKNILKNIDNKIDNKADAKKYA